MTVLALVLVCVALALIAAQAKAGIMMSKSEEALSQRLCDLQYEVSVLRTRVTDLEDNHLMRVQL